MIRRPVRYSWLVLAAILLLALTLRWQHLRDVSYNFDEAFCWKMITFPVTEIWDRSAADNHPPLYFYLLWGWSRVFGSSPTALRSLSVFFGLVAVLGAYLLVRETGRSGLQLNLAGPRPNLPTRYLPALAATMLVALSPFQVDFSQQAHHGYALGAALSVISCWLLLRALRARRPGWPNSVGYVLSAAALIYTHHFGLFVVAGQVLYTVGCLAVSADRARHYCFFASFALIALLYLPWAPSFLRQRQQVSEFFHTGSFTWHGVARACYQTLGVRWEDGPPSNAMGWGAMAACILPAVAMLVWGRGGVRLIGLCVLVTFDGAICASIGDRNIIGSRYFLFANVLLLCGLPLLLVGQPSDAIQEGQSEQAADRPCSRAGFLLRGTALAGLVLGIGGLSWAHCEGREGFARRPGMLSAVQYLASRRLPGEPILVCNPMLQITSAAQAATSRDERISSFDVRSIAAGAMPEPQVLSDAPSAFPYFQGTAVMRREDFISSAELAHLPVRRLWVIDAAHWIVGNWRTDVPHPWADVMEKRFPEWMANSSEIIVRCCERPTTKQHDGAVSGRQ